MDQEIQNEFKSLREFLTESMVSKHDFEERLKTLTTKDDLLELATKTDIGAVRTDIAEVKAATDNLKKTEDEDI